MTTSLWHCYLNCQTKWLPNLKFFPYIGKKAATKKRIESETKTRINIPRQGVENEDIQISGPTRYSVATASNRIDSIVSSSRQRQGFTHFLSIPMNHPEMKSSFFPLC